MANELPEHIWFISTGNGRILPTHRKGWQLIVRFGMALAASIIVALLVAELVDATVGVGLFVVVAVVLVWWFIATARAHSDFSGRYGLQSVGRAPGKSI